MENSKLKTHIQKWEVKYGRPLTEEDYKQICSNLESFITFLKKWDTKNKS